MKGLFCEYFLVLAAETCAAGGPFGFGIPRSSNGRTADSGSANPGPNPGLGTDSMKGCESVFFCFF